MIEPLHPGCRIALARFGMDELGIARAIAAGELTSPQKYENVWLFDLRITGTGAAYRNTIDEYVWRDPAHYLNDEFLVRCNGLAVIVDHPEHSMLNSEEYADRNVGSIMLPYIRGEEVRGIAKIYDDATVAILQNEQYSTSPGVNTGGFKAKTEDGQKLLIENKPDLLDHIAICALGVWDKGGPPTGVSSAAAKDRTDMAEEKKEGHERMDSDIMTKLDGIMTKLDSAHSRLDAMETDRRKDAEETERRQREDKARRDAEGEAAEEKRQAAELERLAAEERKEGEKEDRKDSLHRRDGETCADHSKRIDAMAKKHKHDRMARRDAESEEEHSRRCDGHFRKDAETAEEARALEKAKEERERADKARKDAADALTRENADLKQRLASVEDMVRGMTRETTAEERDTLGAAQARADSIAALFGERVSAPLPGETSLSYRRRVLRPFLQHSAQFKDAKIDSADSAMLTLVENQVYADAQTASRVKANAQPGILIPRISTDAAGRQITKFDGDMMAWLAPFMTDGARCKLDRKPAAA